MCFFTCTMYSDRHTVFLQFGVGAITGSFCGNRKWMQHLRQILTWYGMVWYDMASYRTASYFNALYYMSNLIDLVDIQITRSWLDIFYFWEHFLCIWELNWRASLAPTTMFTTLRVTALPFLILMLTLNSSKSHSPRSHVLMNLQ